MVRSSALLAILLLSNVLLAEASMLAVKRYSMYCSVCCCSILSFICAMAVCWFIITGRMAGAQEEDAWADWEEPGNETNSSDAGSRRLMLESALNLTANISRRAVSQQLRYKLTIMG
eukprot:TRINITY_DN41170_c0_g1_i1.p1 TRINITY_DN41170_c0_g1~~TRINITY_DN41170_c0_g1_i1.p1  ORF type:complete len:126 (-),score=21.41 TRINITY_DN41170_c0_g1_i1:208-558(-)